MKRALSLRTWLALGLVLTLSLTSAAAAAAWLVTTQWQAQRERARRDAAVALLERTALDTPGLAARLTRLGVEADVGPTTEMAVFDKAKVQRTRIASAKGVLSTPGLLAIQQRVDGKDALQSGYTQVPLKGPTATGTLWVRHESAAARWSIVAGAAAVGLAVALALAVALLQRWVLRPLARLASDADRIAGGELTLAPVRTRALEVAQVGEALRGMAGALGSALGASAAAERERRFLISAIAHDLRTPLFTLRGSLEAMERGIGDGTALARAQRKADHLDRLVGDLFAFARFEYAGEVHRAADVDLAEVARAVVETVPAGRVRVELVEAERGRVRGDPVALERLLTNVLDNAVRHARSRVTVTVRGPVVGVLDDGPGFADEDLPHVFEPLFRGDRARGAGGAGLGLAIARRLARAHGGDIEAFNAADGGACVVLSL